MARSFSSEYGTRIVDGIECVLSVLLAIVIAHWIGAKHISWAAFSGYMVMRGHVRESMVRGGLRVMGTLIGSAMALAVVPAVASSWWLAAISSALIGSLAMYGAMTQLRSYAWWLWGLTYEMILMDQMENPQSILTSFAYTRIIEVIAGTIACLIISSLSTITLRRRWPAAPSPAPAQYLWQPVAFRHSIQCGLALALLPVIQHFFDIRETAQSAVSIMAVMLIPVTSIRATGLVPVSKKIGLRVIGCVAGALLSAVILHFSHHNSMLLLLGTAVGVFIGRQIENGRHSIIYLGTQFTLAVLVTLVPDRYNDADIVPALNRLYGILVGLAVVEPVLIVWHMVRARLKSKPAETFVSAGIPHKG
jgi:uncharacterized membrane protein YccC